MNINDMDHKACKYRLIPTVLFVTRVHVIYFSLIYSKANSKCPEHTECTSPIYVAYGAQREVSTDLILPSPPHKPAVRYCEICINLILLNITTFTF